MASTSQKTSNVYPISCIRCRRRKIKCNKVKPCNHCLHKGTPCEFPSTYRNIPVTDEAVVKEESTSESSEGLERTQSRSPSVGKLEEELHQLRVKSSQLEKALQEVTRDNQNMSSEINDKNNKSNVFKVKGETSEKGEKYYGPLLSNNMVEEMQDISENNLTRCNSLGRHSWTTNSQRQLSASDSDSGHETVEPSFHKKPLPWVLENGAAHQKNSRALKLLINNFFDTRSYDYFICRRNMLDFVDNHPSMEEPSEIDDELLVLYMILLLLVARLTPAKFNEMGGVPVNDFAALSLQVRLLKKSLFKGFSMLRHNLLNESHVTVQAYILCTEWEFLEGRYEESWSMMFHSCSIAYALGLHVVLKPNKYLNTSPSHLLCMQGHPDEFESFEQYKDDYFKNKLPKVRVWFSLLYMSAQMCSILGRPNPILLQTNPVSLPTIKATTPSEENEHNKLVNALLKSGLSECLRLSNLNLIESFMQEICMDNVFNIDNKYREELEALTYYLSPQYQALINTGMNYIDELTQLPSSFRSNDARDDLLVLHVNRIKYLEPLLDRPQDTRILLALILDSMMNFLDHLIEIAQMFTKEYIPFLTDGDRNTVSFSLQKIFCAKDPLLTSFIYQGVVVTFIVLHTRANKLVEFNGVDYIARLSQKFHTLLELHYLIGGLVGKNINLWSSKQLVLMHKVVEHTNVLMDHFRSAQQSSQANFEGFSHDPQVTALLGNNLRDAFWVENPENSPYYLGLSRDDGNTNQNTSTMMGNSGSANFERLQSFSETTQANYTGDAMQDESGMIREYETLQNNLGMPPNYQ